MESILGVGLLTVNLLLPGLPATHHASMERDAAVVGGIPGASGLGEVIARDARRAPQLLARPSSPRVRSARDSAQNKNWIQRHPSCFGSAVGFVAGFLVGFLPGDDAVFDDFTAAFNGAVLGGIGAGAGAILGWIAGRD